MINYLKANAIAIIALLFSCISLIFNWHTKFREKVKLLIEQDFDNAFCLEFTWYQKYKCAFLYVCISNKSKSPVSISKITISDKSNNQFQAGHYNGGDLRNDNGLTLYKNAGNKPTTEGFFYNIKSENILNNLRIDSFGVIQGYLYFDDFPQFKEKSKQFILNVFTPSKSFSKEVTLFNLPEDIEPYHR